MPLRPLAILLLAVAGSAVTAGQSSPINTLTAAERQEGWKLLFDGKSLAGWRAYDPSIDPAKGWKAEDGCLKITGTNGQPGAGGGDIVTADQFVDFDFRFEWRIAGGSGNSGVKYLVHERTNRSPMWTGDDGHSAIGHEYQIIDDARQTEVALGATGMTGALYALVAPSPARKVNPVGQFNESRIVLRGAHAEHWLNGARIVEYELGSPALLKAIAGSKFKPVPGFGTKFKTRILLQDHGDSVWFRNLKIRPL
jgi:hypothetical protein